MDKFIEIKNLSKNYGKVTALDEISLAIDQGAVVGILGPNGSGKSTLIKTMAGLVKADSGEIIIGGSALNSKSRGFIAYLSDEPYMYENFKVADIIKVYSDFFDDFDKDFMDRMVEYLYIDKKSKIKGLTKGDAAKLGICLNLARDAKLYLFDEPLDGVDPISAQKLIDIIIDKIDGEKTFVISTHQIGLFEKLFDQVIFLNNGEVYEQGSVRDIRNSQQIEIKNYYDRLYMG